MCDTVSVKVKGRIKTLENTVLRVEGVQNTTPTTPTKSSKNLKLNISKQSKLPLLKNNWN